MEDSSLMDQINYEVISYLAALPDFYPTTINIERMLKNELEKLFEFRVTNRASAKDNDM
jgi:hypothetical protein